MGKCNNCKIEILDETEYCPLCQSVLTPTEELENMYPDVRFMMRRFMLFTRIYLFCAILVQVVLFSINWVCKSEIWWSAITGLVFFCIYMILRYAILGKSDYKIKVFILALIGVLASIVIDFVIGYRGWSVNYVLPAMIVLVDIIIIGCMIYNRRNWQSYIMWQIFMILCSLIPAGLYIGELAQNPYVALSPLAASIALFLGTMIIGDHRARVELKRRFHIY